MTLLRPSYETDDVIVGDIVTAIRECLMLAKIGTPIVLGD